MSIPDLAAKMDIDKAGIYKWEDGSVIPGGKSLTVIAEALGITVNDLLMENNTHDADEAAITEKTPKGDPEVYRTIVEGNTEYVLILRSVMKDSKLISVDQWDTTKEMVKTNQEIVKSNQEIMKIMINEFVSAVERLSPKPAQSQKGKNHG